jgi:hypothetical protein
MQASGAADARRHEPHPARSGSDRLDFRDVGVAVRNADSARIDLVAVSRTGSKLDVPPEVSRVAENYNHLHEQPTLFYALALAAQLANAVDGISVALAWTYVGLRVIHSFVQATRNVILVRFYVFAAASFVLLLLLLRTILLLV